LPQLAEEPWKKLCKAVDQLPERTDDKKLHQIRIKAKRCRYAVEAVAPVGGKAAVRFARRVANVQKVLGDLHDAVVAEQRLREIKGARGEVFAAGGLAAMEALVAADARIAWRKAWKKASKKSLRSWM
jgi:CHAD domain-containing protein